MKTALRKLARRLRPIFQKLPVVRQVRRLRIIGNYLFPSIRNAFIWLFKNSEESNFYYKITDQNRKYLASTISLITKTEIDRVIYYFAELENDSYLRAHISEGLSRYEKGVEVEVDYGRRVGWYALVRITKPALVVETGVDHGVGSCVISAALLKNAEDGFEGKYLGTEINPLAGKLLSERYASVGQIQVCRLP